MSAALAGGFAEPVFAAQKVFRAVMDALARPGSLQPLLTEAIAPAPLMPELAALALTLLDHDSPAWLDPALAAAPEVAEWLRFHTGAPLVGAPGDAMFALVAEAAALPPLDAFALGTDEYPDRSTSLLLGLPKLTGGPLLTLVGPGIETATQFSPAGLPKAFRRNGRGTGRSSRAASTSCSWRRARSPACRARPASWRADMYVAVKGGEAAIANAHRLLADRRRGDRSVPALRLDQIVNQLGLAVDRAMGEGSLYDPELAALAIVQARGDLIEAIFLLRAYRTTLPRFGYSAPIDTGRMLIERRVSATFKDLPGGQLLGPTFDYTHRLLDPEVAAGTAEPGERRPADDAPAPRVTDLLGGEGLIEPDSPADSGPIGDLTREPLEFPLGRDLRLQALARGDEGFLLGLAYSTQRGYARSHPFVGEIRIGEVEVELDVPELGFAVSLGRVRVTECQMVNQFKGSAEAPPQFTRGYGLAFGQAERKAMAMALCDRALRAREFGEDLTGIAQDEEFVISHLDNVQSTGFVEHLKLPHYVDFQAELDLVRRMRAEYEAAQAEAAAPTQEAAE